VSWQICPSKPRQFGRKAEPHGPTAYCSTRSKKRSPIRRLVENPERGDAECRLLYKLYRVVDGGLGSAESVEKNPPKALSGTSQPLISLLLQLLKPVGGVGCQEAPSTLGLRVKLQCGPSLLLYDLPVMDPARHRVSQYSVADLASYLPGSAMTPLAP
jgi:hypothetical protein